MESLGDILKGKEPTAVVEQPKPEAQEVVETQPETEAQRAERERDEKGRFKAKDEAEAKAEAKPEAKPKVEPAAPTAAEKAKPTDKPNDAEQLDPRLKAAIAQANDERRKRQEYERRLQAFERQQQSAAPDLATDPQGFQAHLNETLQSREIDMRVNISHAMARKQYQDYDSVMEKWPEMIAENPALYQTAIGQELPADWAYNFVKRQLLMQEIGDPAAWREAEQARIRAEVEAELAQKYQQQPKPHVPVPPPSLANAKSATGSITSTSTYSGPTPLKSILRS